MKYRNGAARRADNDIANTPANQSTVICYHRLTRHCAKPTTHRSRYSHINHELTTITVLPWHKRVHTSKVMVQYCNQIILYRAHHTICHTDIDSYSIFTSKQLAECWKKKAIYSSLCYVHGRYCAHTHIVCQSRRHFNVLFCLITVALHCCILYADT